MNPVTWFEIPVHDMDRAKKFYEAVLNTNIHVVEFGGLLMGWFPFDNPDAPGSSGSLIKHEEYVPSYQGTLIYFGVEEINDVTPRIEKAGGKVLNPKTSIGEFGFVAHFEDTEGNRVALHQAAN
jgi:uncharacterized protein